MGEPTVLDEILQLRAEQASMLILALGPAVRRAREAERLIAHAVQLMTPDQVGQWRGVRAWQEDDGMELALDGEVKHG